MKEYPVLLAMLFALFTVAPLHLAQGGQAESRNNAQGEFIDIFHDSQGRNVTPAATQYIEACCSEVDVAIKLLKENGFDVREESESDRVRELNQHWKTESTPYSKFIFGDRGAGWWRVWRFFTVYEVVLFIRNGKVERVYAEVDTTYP